MTAITTLTFRKIIQCQLKLLVAEVRPIAIRKIEFSIGKLPEKEITYAVFTTGTNTKIGIRVFANRRIFMYKIRIDGVFVQFPRGNLVDDLGNRIRYIPTTP